MIRKKLAFLGAGSFSDGVLPWIDNFQYEFVGYFDDKPIKEYRGYPIFGKLSDCAKFLESGEIDCVFISIGDPYKRKEVFENLADKYYHAFANIISNKANIFDANSIQGRGIFVGFSSFVGADSYIHDNCIINTGAIVEHHTTVEAHCNIAPRATINGLCHIGTTSYLGSGCVVVQTTAIAHDTIIGAGAVVLKSIDESGTYVGVPAKKIK